MIKSEKWVMENPIANIFTFYSFIFLLLFSYLQKREPSSRRDIISLTLTFGSLCPHVLQRTFLINWIRLFAACGHNKLCPYGGWNQDSYDKTLYIKFTLKQQKHAREKERHHPHHRTDSHQYPLRRSRSLRAAELQVAINN